MPANWRIKWCVSSALQHSNISIISFRVHGIHLMQTLNWITSIMRLNTHHNGMSSSILCSFCNRSHWISSASCRYVCALSMLFAFFYVRILFVKYRWILANPTLIKTSLSFATISVKLFFLSLSRSVRSASLRMLKRIIWFEWFEAWISIRLWFWCAVVCFIKWERVFVSPPICQHYCPLKSFRSKLLKVHDLRNCSIQFHGHNI